MIRFIARFLPWLTVRRLMLVVVGLALGMNGVRCIRDGFTTRYAPGYSEAQFQDVQIGMTRDQVAQIVGYPLRIDSTSERWAPYENWMYSDPPIIWDNYHRRWIMFADGKVATIIDDWYWD